MGRVCGVACKFFLTTFSTSFKRDISSSGSGELLKITSAIRGECRCRANIFFASLCTVELCWQASSIVLIISSSNGTILEVG